MNDYPLIAALAKAGKRHRRRIFECRQVSGGPDWFAPKRFGIGAGLPIGWQGWATLGAYLAALFACVWRWGGNAEATIAIMLPLTMLLLLVTWRTNRGGWRWRWGEED